ncbi:MAG: hypothetical protein IH628_02085, partial [Proteobacteria bacterium]|nr:hypothetical protein [Pseudomonadota bacterium]
RLHYPRSLVDDVIARAPRSFVLPGQDITRETILEPGEVVTSVLLPKPDKGLRSSYRKVRARGSWDFALAGVALALSFSKGKVVGAALPGGGGRPRGAAAG